MITITVDRELRARLGDLAELVELLDEQGQIIGYVTPISSQRPLYEDLEVPTFTAEEVQRLLNQPPGRPLADILADLEKTP
jgi:hypothetical protein